MGVESDPRNSRLDFDGGSDQDPDSGLLEFFNGIFIISTKWTKWMAEIMFSFDVCASVCLCVCVCAVDRWKLNANSSKTVKATDFKFDTRVPRDSSDMTAKNFPKSGRL